MCGQESEIWLKVFEGGLRNEYLPGLGEGAMNQMIFFVWMLGHFLYALLISQYPALTVELTDSKGELLLPW